MSFWFAYFAELEMELGHSAQKHLFCPWGASQALYLQLSVSRWKHPEKIPPSWVKDQTYSNQQVNRTYEEAAGALGDGLGLPLSAQPWLHSSSKCTQSYCYGKGFGGDGLQPAVTCEHWTHTAEAREREQCLCAKSSRILTVFCNESPVTFSLNNKPREAQMGSLGL